MSQTSRRPPCGQCGLALEASSSLNVIPLYLGWLRCHSELTQVLSIYPEAYLKTFLYSLAFKALNFLGNLLVLQTKRISPFSVFPILSNGAQL